MIEYDCNNNEILLTAFNADGTAAVGQVKWDTPVRDLVPDARRTVDLGTVDLGAILRRADALAVLFARVQLTGLWHKLAIRVLLAAVLALLSARRADGGCRKVSR